MIDDDRSRCRPSRLTAHRDQDGQGASLEVATDTLGNELLVFQPEVDHDAA